MTDREELLTFTHFGICWECGAMGWLREVNSEYESGRFLCAGCWKNQSEEE